MDKYKLIQGDIWVRNKGVIHPDKRWWGDDSRNENEDWCKKNYISNISRIWWVIDRRGTGRFEVDSWFWIRIF